MIVFLKKIIACLPFRWQQELKRCYCSWQIHHNRFKSDEKEYDYLDSFISPGDWVLDIGANIGHYTAKFSLLVGTCGRVIALEPVLKTFELLTANAQFFPFHNVTLLNVAASNQAAVLSMEMPIFETGLKNYYRASLSEKETDLNVFCIPIDSLPLNHRIKMIKIDTEGHELSVLHGMKILLQRDHPTLIVETSSLAVVDFLKDLAYIAEKIPKSPNYVFRHTSIVGPKML
jgi:FkbM family methyltransferase